MIRPSGISATKEEKAAAVELADEVERRLQHRGFPRAVRADSGNGSHLIYVIDLPTNDDGLIERVLQALAFRFDTDRVKIDQTVGKKTNDCRPGNSTAIAQAADGQRKGEHQKIGGDAVKRQPGPRADLQHDCSVSQQRQADVFHVNEFASQNRC